MKLNSILQKEDVAIGVPNKEDSQNDKKEYLLGYSINN